MSETFASHNALMSDAAKKFLLMSLLPGFGNTTLRQWQDGASDDFKKTISQDEATCLRLAALKRKRQFTYEWSELIKRRDQIVAECERLHIDILCPEDEAYPFYLRQVYDRPACLYVQTCYSAWHQSSCIAVVGARKPSAYTLNMTRSIVRDMARQGLVVVSGLAHGVDQCAHESALDVQGITFAVLGGGLGKIYPASNQELAARILRNNGALISEHAPDIQPRPEFFPMRNRIISGLCKGVLVSEASLDSGSLITASCALEQNRDVYALCHRADDLRAHGSLKLLKSGAKLVTQATDILEEYGFNELSPLSNFTARESVVGETLSAPESRLRMSLMSGPLHYDKLKECFSDMDAAFFQSLLLDMQLSGAIDKLPGNFFAIRK